MGEVMVSRMTEDEQTPAAVPEESPAPAPAKPSKADRLEAKAARLREEAERAAAAPPRQLGQRPAVVLLAVSVASALLLTAVLVLYFIQLSHKNSKIHGLERALAPASARPPGGDLGATALAAAQQYAVDFSSYDYANLDHDIALVESHLTPDYRAKYEQITSELRTLAPQYKSRETGVVQGAGIQSLSSSTAVVVLFLDQTVTSTQVKTPRIDRNRMVMTLQRQPDGTWLISDMTLQ